MIAMNRQWSNNETGISLISTIMISTILLVCGFSVISLSMTEQKIASNQRKAVQALYLAEAGVQKVLAQLRVDPHWNSGLKNEPLGEGWIRQVEVKDKGDKVEILSTGEVEGVQRKLRVELIKTNLVSPHAVQATSLLDITGSNFPLSITGDMVIHGNLTTGPLFSLEGGLLVQGKTRIEGGNLSGTIAGSGPVEICEGAIVNSHVFSGGTITGGNLVENGYLVLDHLPVSLPGTPEEPDFDWYQSRADVILEQGLLSVDELVSGLYFTSEDLTITSSNTYQGRFIIASTGMVRIQSDLIPRDPGEDSLIIIAREIEMDPGAGEIHGSFVGAETFRTKGSWEAKNIFGTVQSRQVILSSKSTRITYRPWFVPGLAPGNRTTLYHISHWQEITPL